ncbi:hypothetical protein ACFWXK_11570 [Streptomyces sp. NPDC059070]|uniref:hypothetical protein n=1 Tax=unclassified Streptomyces TaxID=2593676 RepID=UPI0034E218C9
MKPNVSIIALVDVIGALSDRTLLNGNLGLVDDGSFDSTGQGTPSLCTVVEPGQTVQWTALAVDLQTPVEIRNITFLRADGAEAGEPAQEEAQTDAARLDLDVWSGVVPYLPPGVPHKYRLELQMYDGANSVLHIDSPALMCQ